MNENRPTPGSNFEDRLLSELKNVVEQRGAEAASADASPTPPARRIAPRLAMGAAAVCAAAGAVLVFNSGSDGTSKAFAVESQEGGGVTISVYSAEDAGGLEKALGEAGIAADVSWLPAGMECQEPRFTQSSVKTPLGGTIGGMRLAGPGEALKIAVMSTDRYRELRREFAAGEISDDQYYGETGNIVLDPAEFRPDQTVVISGSRGPYEGDPEGGYEAGFAVAEGPVAPCEVTPVPDNASLKEMNRVIESEAEGK